MLYYFLNDQNRWHKFFIALFILLSLSIFSYSHGKSEIALQKKIKLGKKMINSFPYLKVKTFGNEIAIFTDRWKGEWKIEWPKNQENLSKNMYVSFRGKYSNNGIVYDIEDITIHKGYKFKLIISVIALIPLIFYFTLIFKYDEHGFYKVRK